MDIITRCSSLSDSSWALKSKNSQIRGYSEPRMIRLVTIEQACGNRIASVSALPVTEFLHKIFCCPNKKLLFSPKADSKTSISWSESIPMLDNSIIWQINLCFKFVGELQHSTGLKIMTYEIFWDNFKTDNYSDTKTLHYLLWYCVLRLKFNR